MPVTFKIPSSPKKSILTIDEFMGVDFTNSPANIEENKSSEAINMIRDVPGKIRKRMGYEVVKDYESGNVNGYHFRREDIYNGNDRPLIHIGDKIYYYKADLDDDGEIIKDADGNPIYTEAVYDGANDAISKAWQFGDNLYIIDGKKMLQYGKDFDRKVLDVHTVESVAYVPTVTIAKEPSGGGTQYEDLNLLQPKFIELFLGNGRDRQYHMTFGGLDSTPVKVWLMNSNADWVLQTEGTHFSVDRPNGVITFVTAPPESPLTGEDNVKIEVSRTVEGYADRINHCKFGTRFGVNGAFDRLFISGNPDYPNSDWYSQQWDCTYFPDLGYSQLGSSRSAVVGYSIISNYLAAHKDEMEQDLSIILREGDMVDSVPTFKIINTLQGAGAISTNSFTYLRTEPLFLTRSGLYAVTAQDITGEKYAQSRSFFLNGKLTSEDFKTLQESFAIVYNDMYLLAVGGDRLYVLDGLQPIRTDKSEPYSTRQYVAFYCDNLPIRYMWERDNRLYFGTTDGKLCRFYNDKTALGAYNDNGEPIYCQWDTPDLDDKLFYKNKTLRYLAIRADTAIRTSVKVYAMARGLWSLIKHDDKFGRYFNWEYLNFERFSFNTDRTQKISRVKVRIKKVDKYRLRLVNDELNEPFALYNIAMEYLENGNYKG